MQRVLVVDDEQSILELLAYTLEKEGYQIDRADDGLQALQMAQSQLYQFIILDLMLPSMSGIDVCKELRKQQIDVPILILTAKDDETDKIIGLELGADDYMTKPFSPREVLARMKAIFRRTKRDISQVASDEAEEEVVTFGHLTIHTEQFEVYRAGQLIELTPKEFELLLYMVRRQGRILSREKLLNAVWQYDFQGQTRIVDVHIGHLREKIEDDTKNPVYIKTVRGYGYKVEVPSNETDS